MLVLARQRDETIQRDLRDKQTEVKPAVSDIDWFESQKNGTPSVDYFPVKQLWLVAVAPHGQTRGWGPTFMQAVRACRSLSEGLIKENVNGNPV